MPARPTSLRNQANAIQPFNYAQASGPELPSSIAAINTVNASEVDVMQLEDMRRKDDENRAQFEWSEKNREVYSNLLSDLDPESDEFDTILGEVDPRAYNMPGFREAIGSRTTQRNRFLQREEREFAKQQRELNHFEKGMNGADPRAVIKLRNAVESGEISFDQYKEAAAILSGQVHDAKQAKIQKAEGIAEEKRAKTHAQTQLAGTKAALTSVKGEYDKAQSDLKRANKALTAVKARIKNGSSESSEDQLAGQRAAQERVDELTPEYEVIRDTYRSHLDTLRGKTSTSKSPSSKKAPSKQDSVNDIIDG